MEAREEEEIDHDETVDRDDEGACPELLSVHGIEDHYVNELCAEFRRRIRRFTLPLRYGHLVPTCSLLARPRDPSTSYPASIVAFPALPSAQIARSSSDIYAPSVRRSVSCLDAYSYRKDKISLGSIDDGSAARNFLDRRRPVVGSKGPPDTAVCANVVPIPYPRTLRPGSIVGGLIELPVPPSFDPGMMRTLASVLCWPTSKRIGFR